MLLEHDEIELDSTTKSGETALDIAVVNELKECVRLLIKGGCDVNIQVNIPLVISKFIRIK